MKRRACRSQLGSSLVEATLLLAGGTLLVVAALSSFCDTVSFKYVVAARALSESETLPEAQHQILDGGGTWQGGEAPAWYTDWLRRINNRVRTQAAPTSPP
jgi:hypothetical protein